MVNFKGIHEAVLAVCSSYLFCSGETGIHTNQSRWPVVRVRFRTETIPNANLRRAVVCNKQWKRFW